MFAVQQNEPGADRQEQVTAREAMNRTIRAYAEVFARLADRNAGTLTLNPGGLQAGGAQHLRLPGATATYDAWLAPAVGGGAQANGLFLGGSLNGNLYGIVQAGLPQGGVPRNVPVPDGGHPPLEPRPLPLTALPAALRDLINGMNPADLTPTRVVTGARVRRELMFIPCNIGGLGGDPMSDGCGVPFRDASGTTSIPLTTAGVAMLDMTNLPRNSYLRQIFEAAGNHTFTDANPYAYAEIPATPGHRAVRLRMDRSGSVSARFIGADEPANRAALDGQAQRWCLIFTPQGFEHWQRVNTRPAGIGGPAPLVGLREYEAAGFPFWRNSAAAAGPNYAAVVAGWNIRSFFNPHTPYNDTTNLPPVPRVGNQPVAP